MVADATIIISIEGKEAKIGADQIAQGLEKLIQTGTRADQRVEKLEQQIKKLKTQLGTTTKEVKKTNDALQGMQSQFRRIANSVAVVDGPLGGIASRFNAFATLLGRINPGMVAFAAGTIGVAAAARSTIKEFVPFERAIQRIEGVLVATGRQASLTSQQIDLFAREFGIATLTSRQAVLDASAALLSFGNIGTENFERVITTAQDLTELFGGSLQSNTVRLAQALSDPERAIRILRRTVGGLSEAEEKLLKDFKATNQIAEAQEFIFSKLASTQGAAEAAADSLAGKLDTLAEASTNFQIALAQTGFAEAIGSGIESLTSVFEALEANIGAVSVAGELFIAFLVGRGTIAIAGFTANLLRNTAAAKLLAAEYAILTGAATRVAGSVSILNTALAVSRGLFTGIVGFLGGPLGAALTVTAGLYFILADSTTATDEATQLMNDTLTTAAELQRKIARATDEHTNALIANRDEVIRNAQAEIEAARATLAAEEARLTKLERLNDSRGSIKAGTKLSPEIRQQKDLLAEANEILRVKEEQLEKLLQTFGLVTDEAGKFGEKEGFVSDRVKEASEALELEIDQLQRLIAVQGENEEARRRVQVEIDIENELKRIGKKLTDDETAALEALIRKKVELKDALDAEIKARKEQEKEAERAIREQEREQERIERLLQEPFENAIEGVQDKFTDFFEDVFNGGINSFEDLADGIKGIFTRLAAELVALNLTRAILGTPSIGSFLTGSGGGLGGASIPGAAVAGQAGGGIGSIFDIASLGSGLLSGFQSQFLGNLFAGTALDLGLGASTAAFLGNAGLNSPFGIIGGLGANLLGLGGGIGGTIGGIAGSLAGGGIGASLGTILGLPGGPVGAVIGSFLGTALGGLFGGKPSDKTQTGLIDLSDPTGQIISRTGLGGTDPNNPGKKFSQENFDAVTDFGQLAAALAQTIAGPGGINEQLDIIIGNRDGLRLRFRDELGNPVEQNFGSSVNDFIEGLTRGIIDRAPDVSESLLIAIENIDFSDTEQALRDIEFAAQFDELGKAPEEINEVEQALEELTKAFGEARATAERLGLSVEKVNEAEREQLRLITQGFNESVAQQILSIIDPAVAAVFAEQARFEQQLANALAAGADVSQVELLNKLKLLQIQEQFAQSEESLLNERISSLNEEARAAERLAQQFARVSEAISDNLLKARFADTSPIPLEQRLTEARQAFLDASARAQAGDITAAGELTTLADIVRDLSRQFFASGTGFTTDFELIETELEKSRDVAEQQADLQQQIADNARREVELLNQQINELTGINDSVLKLDESIGSLSDVLIDSLLQADTAGPGGLDSRLFRPGETLQKLEERFNPKNLLPEIDVRQAKVAAGFDFSDPTNQGRSFRDFTNQEGGQRALDIFNAIVASLGGKTQGFAKGGTTPFNRPFIVGENGPELMQLGTRATVAPLKALNDNSSEMIRNFEALRREQAAGTIRLDTRLQEIVGLLSDFVSELSRLNLAPERRARA